MELAYFVGPDPAELTDKNVLIRRQDTLDDEPEEGGRLATLAVGVKSLDFSFYDPKGKLDIVRCAGYWLKDASERGIKHLCWDGCMFPNAMLESPDTWNAILDVMLKVRAAHGWNA